MSSAFRHRGARAPLAGVLLGATLLAGCTAAGHPRDRAQARPSLRILAPPATGGVLTRSFSGAGGTWVVLPMGTTGLNRFWEAFASADGGTRWRLVTPPGVADNGGLVMATDGGTLLAGFVPSQYLAFSPTLRTSTVGRSWGQPGILDGTLVANASALAVSKGDVLGVLGRDGGEIVAAGQQAATGRLITNAALLSRTDAGRACGLEAITGVAALPTATLVAGVCARPGLTGLFEQRHGRWVLAGPNLPPPWRSRRVDVARLNGDGATLTVLLQIATDRGSAVLGAWREGGSSWVETPPLAIRADGRVLATASRPNGSLALLVCDDRGRCEALETGPTTPRWRLLAPLPSGACALALPAAQGVTVFSVRGDTVVVRHLVEALGTSDARWVLVQTLHVPVPYGSST